MYNGIKLTMRLLIDRPSCFN